MATTTATVTSEGLALTPDFMAELKLQPGSRVAVTIEIEKSELPADFERLLQETRGMFAATGGMAEDLQKIRREDHRRFQAKQW